MSDSLVFKAFADNIVNGAQILGTIFEGKGLIVIKGENNGFQHFSLYQ